MFLLCPVPRGTLVLLLSVLVGAWQKPILGRAWFPMSLFFITPAVGVHVCKRVQLKAAFTHERELV